MKRFAALALVSSLAISGESQSGEFGWLAGCWATPDSSALEVWVVDSERSLSGFSVSISDNRVGSYEILTIEQSEEGTWLYTAHPSGQASATFQAVQFGETSVVFANPDHDYPQEIRYRRDGDRLKATVSLLGGANPNSFNKIACDRIVKE